MPFDLKLETPVHGFAESDAAAGEVCTVITRQLLTAADEPGFAARLESIGGLLLPSPVGPKSGEPQMVRNLAAIIRPDQTATVYTDLASDDLVITARAKPKRPFEKGQAVYPDDIADVTELRFEGIDFPADCGIIVYLTVAAEPVLFFDFTPLMPGAEKRSFDVERYLGYVYCYASQRHLFKMHDDDIRHMFASRWFPFITLSGATRRALVECAGTRSDMDGLLGATAGETLAACGGLRRRLHSRRLFADHATLLDHAVAEYEAGDYVSATAILYPRLEGVMRTIHEFSGSPAVPKQAELSKSAVWDTGMRTQTFILLLPGAFRSYLEKSFFANFDPQAPIPLSRNSVGHGVARQTDFDLKSATIGILILDQLSYFVPEDDMDAEAPSSPPQN